MSETAGMRLARLLALVPWLIAHDGITIEAAAEHFGVSPEELERDLWLLVVSGLPGHGPDQLVDIDFWDDGVIHVIDPQTLRRPLRLTPEEGLSLLVALRTLAQVPGIVDRAGILGAAAKVEAALDPGVSVDVLPTVELGVAAEVADAVASAIESDSGLDLTYASASRGEVTHRTVAPLSVHLIDGVAYLEAWCSSSHGRRTFRIDRILAATTTTRPEVPVTPMSPERTEPLIGRIAVEPAERWVADVFRGATIEGTDAQGRAVVVLPLHSLDWGVTVILSLAGGAVALEPAALVEGVAARAAQGLQAYSDPLG
jgi:proteasome accessory factor C